MAQPSRGRAPASGLPLMSLEATLDQENQEVLAKLNRRRSNSPIVNPQNRSPTAYRSMLDVDNSAPRHGSIAGVGVGVTSPRDQRKPSKRLNPGDPSTWTSPAKSLDPGDPSTWTSPAKPPSPTIVRTPAPEDVDKETSLSQGLPKIQIGSKPGFEQTYNFDMRSMPTSGGGARSTQERKQREGSSGGAAGERRGSRDFKASGLPFRASSPANIGMLSPEKSKSKSKSKSPSRTAADEKNRRLSNKSNSFSTITSESDEASSRVMLDNDGDEDALEESSSEEDKKQDSSDEESPEGDRGRKRDMSQAEAVEKNDAAERKLAPQAKGVRSLIEPLLSPSAPGEKSKDVHPPSSFGRSGPTAADFADDDDESDIQKAKSLGMSMSPVDNSIAGRSVRMIIRGEWSKFQDETENNNNSSPRLYLACSDLSTEATYALEWTVGTMLRDGDSLLIIYSIEDENAPKEPEGDSQVMTESAQAAQDANDTMETLTRRTTNLESKPTSTKFVPAIDALPLTGSADLSHISKKELERLKALDEITEKFLSLVRKTPLQVRCMIEIIHCKSPKHLILGAIDALEPTLCVVGTRGRNSLKGVLLGSFSNYLVTKSSVPVMVARKRLKKPAHAKVNSTSIRLSNNLTNSSLSRKRLDLASARID